MKRTLDIFAHNVKYLREKSGKSQRRVAIESKMAFATYQRLEGGIGNPTLGVMARLADYFKMDLTCLLDKKL